MATLHSIVAMASFVEVNIRALFGGMNLAKSQTGQKKSVVITAHLCSEMAVFDRNFTFQLHIGEVPLEPWGDIHLDNWDGQTLYCFNP
jgi:hypothetical protein